MFARFALPAALLLALNAPAVEISGRILGHDNRPLPKAMLILRDGSDENLTAVYAAPDGTFRVTAAHPGLYRVQIMGVFHENQDVYVLTEASNTEPIQIEARLQAAQYHPNPNVRLAAYGQAAIDQKPFQKQSDGTWLLEFDYTQSELLAGVSGVARSKAIAIPEAGEYRRRFNGILNLLRPVNGKIRIVFDPAKLPRSDNPPLLSFGTAQSGKSQLHELCTAIRKQLDEQKQRRSAQRMGRTVEAARYSHTLAELFAAASREQSPSLRAAKWLLYLVQAVDQENDLTRIAHALEQLTPASPLWTMAAGIAAQAVAKAGNVDYLLKLAAGIPHPPSRVTSYSQMLWNTSPSMRPPLLERMRNEFPNEYLTKAAIADYDPASQIQVGQVAPRFSIPSLSAPATVYSQDSIKANFYLIDFWATWCGPCVAEMPSLHRIYQENRPKGFEILSVSLDESRDAVLQFRAARFPMPWLHAIDAGLKAFDTKMAKDFGVYGLPRAFLLDSNGKILAMDDELRGENLEKTIAKVFAGLR